MVVLESDQRRPGARHPHDLALGTRFWSGLDGAIPVARSTSMTAESAEATALFRYRVIAEAIGPRLSPAGRGWLVRELARQLHEHPDGSQRHWPRGPRSVSNSRCTGSQYRGVRQAIPGTAAAPHRRIGALRRKADSQ